MPANPTNFLALGFDERRLLAHRAIGWLSAFRELRMWGEDILCRSRRYATPLACPSQLDHVTGRALPLGHGEHMGCPRVEHGALLGRPVMALIDPGDAGAAAADVVRQDSSRGSAHSKQRARQPSLPFLRSCVE